jgi:hypothetical protein
MNSFLNNDIFEKLNILSTNSWIRTFQGQHRYQEGSHNKVVRWAANPCISELRIGHDLVRQQGLSVQRVLARQSCVPMLGNVAK